MTSRCSKNSDLISRLSFRATCRIGQALLAWAVLLSLLVVAAGRPALAAADTLDINARIHIMTAGEPDATGDYVVDTYGNITLLYVGNIHVEGLTIEVAKALITKKLLTYYRDPEVIVSLLNPGGVSVELKGEVGRQGSIGVRSDAHLSDILLPAGTSPDADLSNVLITHGRPGEEHTTDTVDYAAYKDQHNPIGNPQVRDGDVIEVKSKHALPISIILKGQVAAPGQRNVLAKSTVFDAIQQSGGLTADAVKSGIFVQHANSDQQIAFDYDVAREHLDDPAKNPLLLDGDTITIKGRAAPLNITIKGQVGAPGLRTVVAKSTVYEAIQQAGGLALDANKKGIFVQHADSDQQIAFDYDIARENLDDPQKNPLLVDGDTIVVKGLERPRTYTISGAVHNPAQYPMTTDSISLADAIGQAGGIAAQAHMKEAYIIRRVADNNTQTIKFDATSPDKQGTTQIYPGDNVVIPQGSPGPQGMGVLGVLESILGLGFLFRH